MPQTTESHFLLNREVLRSAGFLSLIFLMSLTLVTGTTLATTLFLSQAGASALPLFFILFALVSTPISALIAWWADHTSRLMIMWSLWLLLGGMALIAWLAGIHSATSAFVFYLGVSTTELLLGSLAGILLSDYFSLTQSKRMTGKLSLMLALGGICGALLVSFTAIWLSPGESLWLITVISLLGLLLVFFYHHWQKPLAQSIHEVSDEPSTHQTAGQQGLALLLTIFRQQHLARWLTAGVVLAVVVQCLQEILAFTLYENHYNNEQSLAVFLGFAVGLLHLSSLLFATLIAGQLLPRIGVSRAHLFHPLFNLFAFACVALSGRLWSGVVAHIASDPLDVSVNSPTSTLLYNALPMNHLGKLRLFNDGIVYPLALGLSGLLLLLIEPLFSLVQLAMLGGVLSLLLLLVHWRSGQCYEQNLKNQVSLGTLQLSGTSTGGLQPRARGMHSYTAADYSRDAQLEKITLEDTSLTKGKMNQWLTQLHQPSTAQQVLPYIHALDDRQLRKVLLYMLPKLTQHPLDSLILFIRALPPLNDRISILLALWFRKHWGNPLIQLYRGYGLTSRIKNPLVRRLVHLVTENYRHRAQCVLLELLRPFDDKNTLQGIETRLYAGDSRQQAQALETLSLIPQRHLTYWLSLVFEPLPRISFRALIRPSHYIDQDMINLLRHSPDPWMKKMAEVYTSLSQSESCRKYVGASLMERLELLHQVPLFAELSLDDLQSLDAQLRSRKISAGEHLFSEGDPGDCLYILVAGKMTISRSNEKGEAVLLAQLDAGQPVGEMALLDELPRSATAVASEDCELLRLDKLRFHSLVMQRPQILLGMCKVLATRLRG